MSGPPVVITTSLGRPVTNVASLNGAVPMVVVDALGEPVTLVDAGGEPITLLNADGTLWSGSVSALAQILALEPTALWWPSEATMTVARDGTGAAPVAGEPVGRMLDLTPNGVNAIAPGDSNRPLLGRVPVTGRRNLLTRTEEFDNAAWVKFNATVTANAAVAPDATTTADALFETNTTAGHALYQAASVVAGQVVTASVYIKPNGRDYAFLRTSNGGSTELVAISVDLVNGTAASATGTPTDISCVAQANGFFRVSFSCTTQAITANYRLEVINSTDGVYANRSYAGDVTKGIYIWGAQLELGSTATAYQKVVTALDVTEAGVADTYYTSHDGVDDHFALSSSIPITEEMTVVRAFGRSAAGIHSIGLGTTAANRPREGHWGTDNTKALSLSTGIGTAAADTATGSNVFTSVRNASTEKLRTNGTESISVAAAAVGAVPFSALGNYGGNHNNGPISFLAVFDRELTGAELELVESIAAGTNGATLA